MKSYYRDNKLMTLVLLGISLTFWGAMFALPILGLYQLGITFKYNTNRDKLKKASKKRLNSYLVSLITLIITTIVMNNIRDMELGIMTMWFLCGFILALIHLSISYKIKHQNEL